MTTQAGTVRPTITVGYDNSATARVAVSWAAAEARARGTGLRVVTVWNPSPIAPWSLPELTAWQARARAGAELAVAKMRSIVGGRVMVQGVAVEGSPGRVLVHESHTADLLVIGSAGHLGVIGLLSGSVSRYCLHRAHCPVVVVGPDARPNAVERLVLSSTLDPDGETYPYVAEWLRHRRIPVHVITSYDLSPQLPELVLADSPHQIHAAVVDQSARWVAALRTMIGTEAPLTSEVVEGRTQAVLLDRTGPGDLLVVPSGCEHYVSFAEESCPVVVVPTTHHARARDPEFQLSDASVTPAAVAVP